MRSHISAMVILLPALLGTTGCRRPAPPRSSARAARPTPVPGSLESAAFLSQVYPLASGCSYVQARQGTFWHICGHSATRVTGLPVSVSAEVYPLADGSALILDNSARAFYSLRGAQASRVTEVAPSDVPSAGALAYPGGFHFVTSAANARLAADAEDRAESALGPTEGLDDETGTDN